MAEYDYQEAIMGEMVPTITVPLLLPTPPIDREPSVGTGVLDDLERLMQEERLGEERRIQMLKEKQQHISEQVGRRLAEKERKIRELEEEQKRRLYSECTFKPKTSHQKSEKRSLNQFLHQQDQFTRKVAEKRSTLKNTLDSKQNAGTFHPKINKNRNEKVAPESSVFERLYALKDKENTEDNQQEVVEDFHPRITDKSKRLTRNTPIDNLLYNDALRRQERAREISALSGVPEKQERQLNLNNQKYVAQKFIKEYFGVMQRLSVPASSQAKIEYVLFNEILKEMGFAGVEEEGDNNLERTLVHEAYQTLERCQVNAKNICVFLLAIIGVYHINPVNFQEGQASLPDLEFALDQPEGRKLQKYFDLFKRNRLFSEAGRKEAEKQQRQAAAEQAQNHHPRINKASEEMAERYREQMLEEVNQLLENYPELDYSIPADGVISHTDLLILNNLARELKQQHKKEEANKKQFEECTFKPATLPNSMHNSTISSVEGGLGHKKSLELYNYHRNLQSKKESLRLSRQSQDADLKECTFAPVLNHAKVSHDTRNYHTKQVEEALYRMKKGRHDREEKQKFLQRGERPKKEAEYFSLKEKPSNLSEPEEAPTLLLDVNLGDNKMDRITLYPGDEGRLQEIAGQFAARHGLDAENKQKLCQLLKIQLESVLMKIEEDEESENDQ